MTRDLELIDSFHLKIQSDLIDFSNGFKDIDIDTNTKVKSSYKSNNDNYNNYNNNNNDSNNNNIYDNLHQRTSESRNEYLKLFDVMRAIASNPKERSLKIYFRTSETLVTLLKFCKMKCEYVIDNGIHQKNKRVDKDINSLDIDNENFYANMENIFVFVEVSRTLDLICVLIDGERAAKKMTVETGLISQVKLLLIKLQKIQQEQQQQRELKNDYDNNRNSNNISVKDVDKEKKNNDDESDRCFIRLIISTMHFICVCCHDDSCEKSRSVVSTDRSVLLTVGSIIGNYILSAFAERGRERDREVGGIKGITGQGKGGKGNAMKEDRKDIVVMRNLDLIIELILEGSRIGTALSFLVSGENSVRCPNPLSCFFPCLCFLPLHNLFLPLPLHFPFPMILLLFLHYSLSVCLSHSLSLSLTACLSLSLSLPLFLSFSLSLSLSVSLSLSLSL